MEREDVLERTVAFVCRNFIVDRGDFALDQSLIDQGIIDSFGLVELSGFMQSEFGMTITEGDMNRANFGSIYKMVDFILSRTSA